MGGAKFSKGWMGRKICPLTHISIVATYAAIGVDGEENVSHSACKFNGCIRSPRGGWGGKGVPSAQNFKRAA